MGTIANLIRRFEAIDTTEVIGQAFDNTTEDLADQNRAQLHAGYNKDGELIGDSKPYQSSDYAIYKANKNPLPGLGNPDLEDEGDFYRGIKVSREGDTLQEGSTDEKSAELEGKYAGIFGLGGEFKSVYVNKFLKPEFKTLMEDATGLKFE